MSGRRNFYATSLERRASFLCHVLLLTFACSSVYVVMNRTTVAHGFEIIVSEIAIVAGSMMFCRHARDLAERRLRRAEWLWCMQCDYELSNSNPRVPCPECGVRWDPVIVSCYWRRQYTDPDPID